MYSSVKRSRGPHENLNQVARIEKHVFSNWAIVNLLKRNILPFNLSFSVKLTSTSPLSSQSFFYE